MAALLFIVQAISIHALREEGDARRSPRISPLCISIHALREEGDQHGDKLLGLLAQFLSTPSARRATRLLPDCLSRCPDFYPRPPRGGRLRPCVVRLGLSYFYPRPPRGGRLISRIIVLLAQKFLSTPSARRATYDRISCMPIILHFYPRPPRGGRPYPRAG